MIRSVIATLFSVMVFAGCQPMENPAVVKNAIEEQNKIFVDAFNKEDVAGVMSVYWNSPELVAYYPDGNYKGYESVKRSWESFFQSIEMKKFEVTEDHVVVGRDFAYEYGTFELVFQVPGGPVVEAPGRYLEIWEKKEGKWVLIVDHASSPLPPPPPPGTGSAS